MDVRMQDVWMKLRRIYVCKYIRCMNGCTHGRCTDAIKMDAWIYLKCKYGNKITCKYEH